MAKLSSGGSTESTQPRKVTWSNQPDRAKKSSNPTNKTDASKNGGRNDSADSPAVSVQTDPQEGDNRQSLAARERASSGGQRRSATNRQSGSGKRGTQAVLPETIQGAPSVNEAERYRTYTLVQDPMKNHEQYLRTHYDRIRRIHAVHKKGTVDCKQPYSMGKYLSRFDILQRWAKVNLDRANYTLFELFSTAESHYDVKEWMRAYDARRAAMDEKVRNAKIYPRNRIDQAKRYTLRPKARQKDDFYRTRQNGLN